MEKGPFAPRQSSPSVTPVGIGVWVSALFRPSVATYQQLIGQLYLSPQFAYTWILGSALIGGLIASLSPLLAALLGQAPFDSGLLLAIPIYGLIATLVWAIFVGCIQGVARLLKGAGTYSQMACLCATFSAPLIVIVSALASIPWGGVLSLVLSLYWLILYTIALRVVDQFSRARAFSALLIAVLVCGGAFLGVVLGLAYWLL